jgi:tetratricopeptide (TPR) repeat protein
MMRLDLKLIAALSILPLTVGCPEPASTDIQLLEEGRRAYDAKQYDRAIEILTRFINAGTDREQLAVALYTRGAAEAAGAQPGTPRRQRAYADVQRAAASSSDPTLQWRAAALLGTMYFEDEQWASAIAQYRTAIERMPKASPMDMLLYRQGLCLERTNRWSEARTVFQWIVNEFTGGPYAAAALRRIALNADHFAIQCGVFAEKRNAEKLAADLRAKGYSADVRPELIERRTKQVVFVGRFTDYAEALRELARVKASIPDAVLWP